MDFYIRERSSLFNEGTAFSCPDSCERFGCKDPNLHVSVSLVDMVAISLISGKKVLDLFKEDCKVGFDPLDEEDPWVGRISFELKKPCSFLGGKACTVYPGRPLACVLFPEYDFLAGKWEALSKKEIFRNYPCVQTPCAISSERAETLNHLMEMCMKETFLSDLYFFGVSPFVVDLKNLAGQGLGDLSPPDKEKTILAHERLELLISERMREGGYIEEWEAKIEPLDRKEGLRLLKEMKRVTDEMALSIGQSKVQMAYQFDGKKLLSIHLLRK